MPIVYIYSSIFSPKLDYVLDFVFKEQLGLDWQLIDEAQDKKDVDILINYSPRKLETKSLKLPYSGYFHAWSKKLIPQIADSYLEEQFDLFAAVFYLLARVEEYDYAPLDMHGRFPSSASILTKKKLLATPVIDVWIAELRYQLNRDFGLNLIAARPYQLQSTIDIDHIYAYKAKPLAVQIASVIKDLFKFQWGRLADRLQSHDPYDKLDEMLSWNLEAGLEVLFFALTAERSQYDKSLSPNNSAFIQQIKKLSQEAEVNIHPSYFSGSTGMSKEKAILENILQKTITKSRQHYLRFTLPTTYQELIKNGITEDYSMGYADQLGFRAGTSHSFCWYDLKTDQPTTLRIYPFSIMDVTLKQYLNLSPSQALTAINKILAQLKALNGTCSIIWHNSSFYSREGWQGWEAVYKSLLTDGTSKLKA